MAPAQQPALPLVRHPTGRRCAAMMAATKMMARLLALAAAASAASSPSSPLLAIEWSVGAPDIPHGTQCSLSGTLGGDWVVGLGNRANPDWDKTKGKGPAGGCWTGGYSLPTSSSSSNWTGLPECPSCVKDTHCHGDFPHWGSCVPGGPTECCTGECGNFVSGGSSAQTVQLPASLGGGEALAMLGGFSHIESTAACYLLRRSASGGGYNWTALPSLPYPIQTGGVAAIGTKLIAVGGGNGAKGGTVWSDVNGTAFGRRVWVLDLAALSAGWVAGPALPGFPREMPTVVAINSSVYVMGGLAGAKNPSSKPPVNCSLGPQSPGVTVDNCGANIQDNWRLAVGSSGGMAWTQLPSNTLTVPGAQPNSVVVANRYILTVGYDKGDGAGYISHPSTDFKANYGPNTHINAR